MIAAVAARQRQLERPKWLKWRLCIAKDHTAISEKPFGIFREQASGRRSFALNADERGRAQCILSAG